MPNFDKKPKGLTLLFHQIMDPLKMPNFDKKAKGFTLLFDQIMDNFENAQF